MIELKPCPFCGGAAKLRSEHFLWDKLWQITCLDCSVRTAVYGDREEAVEDWNRRVENVQKDNS